MIPTRDRRPRNIFTHLVLATPIPRALVSTAPIVPIHGRVVSSLPELGAMLETHLWPTYLVIHTPGDNSQAGKVTSIG
jgi:hypothetical protein